MALPCASSNSPTASGARPVRSISVSRTPPQSTWPSWGRTTSRTRRDGGRDPGGSRSGADAALARLRHQDGEVLHNPLVRWRRSKRLDPVKDRLFYRTSPLGLLKRSTLEFLGLKFQEGVRSGMDMSYGARLWTSGAGSISCGPHRVTSSAQTPPLASRRSRCASRRASVRCGGLPVLSGPQIWRSRSGVPSPSSSSESTFSARCSHAVRPPTGPAMTSPTSLPR